MKLPIATTRLIPIISLIASTSFASLSMAQDTNSGPPPGTLLNRAPDRSMWSVTVQGEMLGGGTASTNANSSTGSGSQKEPSMIQSKVMKSGDTIFEQNVDSQGIVHQVWHFKSGIRVEKSGDGSAPVASPDTGGEDIYSVNFQNADFAALDWISAESYQGKTNYLGSDVMVFKHDVNTQRDDVRRASEIIIRNKEIRDDVNKSKGIKSVDTGPTPPPAKLVPSLAYIDLKSRLPLIMTIGDQKRIYQYAPLTTQIPMPTDVKQAFDDYQQRLKILSQ